MLDGIGDGVVALDAQLRVERINRVALEVLGVGDAGDAVGRPLVELARKPELLDLAAAARDGEGGKVEFELPGSPPRVVRARANPGVGETTVVLLQDVTELRRLETIRQDFVANVSHELRTPVAVVRANVETLLDGALEQPEMARRFLEGIERSAVRMGNLVGDLLDISRIEAGAYPLDIRPVDVLAACRRAVDATSASRLVEERGATVRVDPAADDCPRALADSAALEQVVTNLVENGVKYGGEGGSVTVRALSVDGHVRIEVEDDGPGIAAEHRARLFERFYRVDPGRSREMGGTGLGLSIVKHLVQAMGGQVRMEAAGPHGAIFRVEVPAASDDGQQGVGQPLG